MPGTTATTSSIPPCGRSKAAKPAWYQTSSPRNLLCAYFTCCVRRPSSPPPLARVWDVAAGSSYRTLYVMRFDKRYPRVSLLRPAFTFQSLVVFVLTPVFDGLRLQRSLQALYTNGTGARSHVCIMSV